QARRLMRSAHRAVLATRLAQSDGWPYASLVLLACDHGGAPLLLLSDLAEHSRNIAKDDRVSLLADGTEGFEDPLTGPPLTLLGRATSSPDDRLRARFLARHPSAAFYAGFADFRLYRIVIERGHLVAGFGRIHWIDAGELRTSAEAGALAEAEPGILRHMNEDHGDALDRMAHHLAGRSGASWRMTGIDPEGCDLRRGGEVARLQFGSPVTDAATARTELVRLAHESEQTAHS